MKQSGKNMSDEEFVVCRCESLRWSDLETALAEGASSMSDLKRRTRIGMGPCQGIYCLPFIEHALEKRIANVEPMTFRPPARVVTVGQLAASSEEQ
jgi:bacterioferritin-associated ferredoxin